MIRRPRRWAMCRRCGATVEDRAACYRAVDRAGGAPTYRLRDEGGIEYALTARTAEGARAEAEARLRDGEYGEIEETIWPLGWLIGPRGDEEVRVAIDPSEPGSVGVTRRTAGRTGRLSGTAGGVIVRETCRRCGVRMTVDTWAQDPETGEQGLESVRYDPAEPEEDD